MSTKKSSASVTTMIATVALGIVGYFVVTNYKAGTLPANQAPAVISTNYKDSTYIIDGTPIKLQNGLSEKETSPGSETKIRTQFFGNELRKDINKDGKEDVIFLITQTKGGSGTFYYVVAALKTETGYNGSHALLLGDRIAPQTTEPGPNTSVIINYADRKPNEAFTVSPSIGKSLRLILDPTTMQFGEWVQNFEGESNR